MTGQTAALVNIDKCIACGACQMNCPSEAITVIKKTGCVILIIKEDILKIKTNDGKCEESICSGERNCKK